LSDLSGFFPTDQPIPKPALLKTWSFSSLKSYEACPLRLQYSRVDKIPRAELPPDNPMMRGSRLHEEIEKYILTGEEIPSKLKYDGELIEESRQQFLAGKAQTELSWAFDNQWRLVPSDDPNLWLRAILDVFIRESETEAWVIDWKSGKSWMKDVAHHQQAQLYTVCAFRACPELETIKTSFVYIDEKGKTTHRQYTRDQARNIEITYHNRAVRMTNATTLPPKPTEMTCRYCDFGMSFGNSHCKYDVFRPDCIRPATGHLRGRTVK